MQSCYYIIVIIYLYTVYKLSELEIVVVNISVEENQLPALAQNL